MLRIEKARFVLGAAGGGSPQGPGKVVN
jgi:hypothetical protein